MRHYKTVIVDGTPLSQKNPTGIANFTFQALKTWAQAFPNVKFLLAAPSSLAPHFLAGLSRYHNIDTTSYVNQRKQNQSGSRGLIWFIYHLPAAIRTSRADLFWSPAVILPPFIPSNIDVLLTVYDLVPIKHYSSMKPLSRIAFRLFFTNSIRKSNFLWAISRFVANDLHSTFPWSKTIPIETGCSVDNELFHFDANRREAGLTFLNNLAQTDKYEKILIFVGTIEPRKNLSLLIDLLPDFNNRKWLLLVVGASGWGKVFGRSHTKLIQNYSDSILFLNRITNEQLCDLYHACDLFVSPSLNEGFCMPALESMCCGTPVALANNSAMTELAGIGGVLIDSYDREIWITALSDSFNRTFEPLKQSKLFSWNTAIQKVSTMLDKK